VLPASHLHPAAVRFGVVSSFRVGRWRQKSTRTRPHLRKVLPPANPLRPSPAEGRHDPSTKGPALVRKATAGGGDWEGHRGELGRRRCGRQPGSYGGTRGSLAEQNDVRDSGGALPSSFNDGSWASSTAVQATSSAATGNRGCFISLQILLEHGTSLILNFANC
jgi:hypothetical protein